MKFSRQQWQIMDFLLAGAVLTSSGWAMETRSTKLTSRISELRAEGVDIKSAWSDELNQNKYWMTDGDIARVKDILHSQEERYIDSLNAPQRTSKEKSNNFQ